MSATRTLERTFDIVVPHADDDSQPSNVHTDAGAARYGFQRALVMAVSVYGWSVPLIIEMLGERWLTDGWTDVRFRRPVYHSDHVTAVVTETGSDRCELTVRRPDGDVVTAAELGLGTGPWVEEFHRSPLSAVEPPPDPRPLLTLETAPVGQKLPTLRFETASRGVAGTEPIEVGGRRVVNPAAIASTMSGYGRGVFAYVNNASLDARRHVQHLDLIGADEPVTVAGHMAGAFERNGHHYAQYDGTLYGEDGRLVALARHTVVFKIATRV